MTQCKSRDALAHCGERCGGGPACGRLVLGIFLLVASLGAASSVVSPRCCAQIASPQAALYAAWPAAAHADPPHPHLIVVVGAGGTDEYQQAFVDWAARWSAAGKQAGASHVIIGLEPEDAEVPDRVHLQQALEAVPLDTCDTLWVALIGHGTFDGNTAKFNLRGPDVTAAELAQWLAKWKGPAAVVNCASASGPFINRLAGPDRVIISATKSGYEYNFARFGDYLSASLNDPKADLDKDEQTSLLEAFLAASHRVQQFYEQEARLATEHGLIEDNGDGLGTPADWFRGVRATRTAKEGAHPDGFRANQIFLVPRGSEARLTPAQRRRRDRLELELQQLRDLESQLPEAEYYGRLEKICLEIARIYEQVAEEPDGEPEETAAQEPATH